MADDVVQEDDFDLYTDMICEDSKLALVACRSLPKSVPVPVSPLGPSPELKHMSPDLKPPSPDLKPPSTNLKPQDVKPQSLVPNKPPPEEESLDLYSDIITDNSRPEQSSCSGGKLLASSCAGLSSSVVTDGVATASSGSSLKPGEEDSNLDLYTEILSDELQQRHDSQVQLEQKYSTAVARIRDLEAELQKLKETEEKTRAQNIVIKQNITSLLLTSRTELQRKDREISRLNLLLAKRGGGNFGGIHSKVRKFSESSSSQQKVPQVSEEDTDLPRRGRNSEYDNQKRKRNEPVNEGPPKRQRVGNPKRPVTPEPKDCRKPWSHSRSPDKPERRLHGPPQKERRNDSKYSDQRRKDFVEEGGNNRRSKTSRERDHCDSGMTDKTGTGRRKHERDSHERDRYHEAAERDVGMKKSSKAGPADERSRTRNKSSSDDKEKRIESDGNETNSSGDLRNILKRKREGKGMEQKTIETSNRKRHSSKSESISESSKNMNHGSKAGKKEPKPSDESHAAFMIPNMDNDNNSKHDKQGESETAESLLKNTSVKTKYDAETSSNMKHNSVQPHTEVSSVQDGTKVEKVREFEPSSSSAIGSVMKDDSSNSPTSSMSSSSCNASKEKKRIKPIMLSGKPDVVGNTHSMDSKSCFDSVIHNIEMRERSSFANAKVVVMDVKGGPEEAGSRDNHFLCGDGSTNVKDGTMADLKYEHDGTPSKHCAKQDLSKKVQIGRDVIEHLPVCTVDPHLTGKCVSGDRETVESVAGDLSDRDCSLDLMMEEERCSRTMPYVYVRKCRVQVEHSTISNSDSHCGSSLSGELSCKGDQEEENMDLASVKKKRSKKKHKPKHAGKEKVLSHTVGQCSDVMKSALSGRKSPVTTGVSSQSTPSSLSPKVIQQTEIAVSSSDVSSRKLPHNNDIKLDHVDRRDPRLDYGGPMKVNNATCNKLCHNSGSGINETIFEKSRSENTSTNKLSSHQFEDACKDNSHVEGSLPVHQVDSRLNGHERPPYHVEPFDFTSFPASYAKSESEDVEKQNIRNVACSNTSIREGFQKCHPVMSDHVKNVAHNKDSDDINMNECLCDVATEKKDRHLSVSSDVQMDDCHMPKALSGNRPTFCHQSSVPVQRTNVENVSVDLVKIRSRKISDSQCGSSLPCSVPVECCDCSFKPVDLSVRSIARPRCLSVNKAEPFTESSHFRGFSLSEDGALDLSKKQIQRPDEVVVNCASTTIATKVNTTIADEDKPNSKLSSSNNSIPKSSPRHLSHSVYSNIKSSTLVDLSTTKSDVPASDGCDLVLCRQIRNEKDVEVDSSQSQVQPGMKQDTAALVEAKPPYQEEQPASSDKRFNVSIQSMDRSDTSEECDIISPKRDDNHENTSEESCTSDIEGEEDVTPSTSQDNSVSSSKTVSSAQVSSCSDNPKTACSSETVITVSSVPSKTTLSSCDSPVSADDDSDGVSSSEEDSGSSDEESSEDVCVADDEDGFHCESSQSEILMKTLSRESLPLKNFEKLRQDLLLSDDSSLSYNPESSENLVCTASGSQMSNDEVAKFKLPDMSTSAFARLASSNEPSDKTTSPETVTRKPVTALDEDTQCSLLSLHAEQFEFDCDQSIHGDQFRSQYGEPDTKAQGQEHEDGKSDRDECSEDGEITSDEDVPSVDAPGDDEISVDLRELLKAKQLLEEKIHGICRRESKKPLSSRPCDRENRHKNQSRDRRLEGKVDRPRATRGVDNHRGSKPSTSNQERFSGNLHGSDSRLDRSSLRHRRDEEPRCHSSPSTRIPTENRKDSHRNSSPLSSRSSHKGQFKENHRNRGSHREERTRAQGRDLMDSLRSRGDRSPLSRHSGRRSNRDKT